MKRPLDRRLAGAEDDAPPSIWKEAGPRRDLALGTSGVTAIVLLVSGVPVVVAMAGAGFAGWAMWKALGRIRG